jgi:hypothetical protein
MASEQLKHMNESYANKRFAHFPSESDKTKPLIQKRRQ